MGKAVITFTDTPEGTVAVNTEFEPSITNESESPAQMLAVRAIATVTKGQTSYSLCGAEIPPGGSHPDDCDDCAESAEAD